MIVIGLGANLESPRHGGPQQTLEAALRRLPAFGVQVLRRSRWYRSPPVPAADQPWFVNGVAEVSGALDPGALLQTLHGLEAEFGRQRRTRWEARVLDLDLLAYRDQVRGGIAAAGGGPVLPHPRLHERLFVLVPLAELDPGWRHPVSGLPVTELIRRAPPGQHVEPIEDDADGGAG